MAVSTARFVRGQRGQKRDVRRRQLDGARRAFALEKISSSASSGLSLGNDPDLAAEADGRKDRRQRQVEHRRR